jgi:BirA family biotin operon repressor/biotin-[acetyl-CoA-carboxylase] ligase
VNLLFSLLLEPAVASARLPELTIVAGEACAEAIAHVTGLRPEIKLPNDILIDGRKAAGILAEARDGRVVLGIGVNVNEAARDLPQEIEPPATSLLLEAGHEVDRADLLVEILDRLERAYDEWVAATGS